MASRRKLEVVIVGDSSSLQRALGRAGAEAGVFGKRIGGHTRTLARFAATAGGVVGVGAAFFKAASLTVDFDKSMRNVNSIAQLNEKQFGKLSKSVLRLAGKTGQAPKTLANGLYDLVSSGFDAHESMQILASSAKAATAGLTTTETSTAAVAAVLNAYHRPAKAAANVSDTLFQTVNRGVISFEDLASNIGDVLPFASALHVNLNQVGAAVSTMTKEGISAPETMTRIKNVMQAFIKPSKDMTAAIKETGATSGETLVKQKGFQGAIEALIKTTDGSKESVAKLFPNIRALGGALALTGSNAKTAHGDLKAFKDVSGATDKALKQQSKSIAFQWNKIKSQISETAIRVGSVLVPAFADGLHKVGDFIGGAVKKFDKLRDGGKSVGGALGTMLTDAFKGINWRSIGSKMRVGIGAVASTIGDGFKAINWQSVGNKMAAGLSAAMKFTGTLPGAIAAGIAQAIDQVNTTDLAAKFADVGVKALALITDPMFWVHHLKEAFALVTVAIPIGKILKIPGASFLFRYISKPIFEAMGMVGRGLLSLGKRMFSEAFIGALAEIEKVAPRLASAILHLVTLSGKEMGKLASRLLSPARKAGSAVVSALEGAAGRVGAAVGKLVGAAIRAIGRLTAPLRASAARAASAVAGALRAGAGAAGAAAKRIAQAALNALKGVVGQFADIGRAIVAAIISGMGDLGAAIGNKIASAAKGAAGKAKGIVKAIMGSANEFPGLPTIAGLDAAASARVSGLLFPATRKGEILQSSAQQAVNARRRQLTEARNAATHAATTAHAALRAHPKSKAAAAAADDAENRLKRARMALQDFDAESKRFLGRIHVKVTGLEQIQKFKDAIKGVRDRLHGMAQDAAAVFRKQREDQIAAGPEAQELARLQQKDKDEQDAKTKAGLDKDLADAKASGDVQAQKDAEDAIAAYARSKREEALQDSIAAQNEGLDAEEAAYQGSLDARLQALAGNLEASKDSYKRFVGEVQDILGPLGIGFEGSPDEEGDITPAGPGAAAPKAKAKPKRRRRRKPKPRAVGGFTPIGSYVVGEVGPELFTPRVPGHVTQASQTHGGGGVSIHIEHADIGSTRAARIMANKLAFRVAFA